MSTNRRSMSSITPLIETRDVIAMKHKTGNLYESIAIVSRRANQISVTMKEELHRKLEGSARKQRADRNIAYIRAYG